MILQMIIHVNVRPRLRHDNRARMIANGAGDAFVAWADDRDGGQDTCAQRMNAKGAFV